MVKITYDLDNKKDCEFVEDFYFFKYYIKSLQFDWGKFYNEEYDLDKYEDEEYFDENSSLEKTLNIIINSLNKDEFERFLKISTRLMYGDEKHIVMNKVFEDGNNLIYRYKYLLTIKFGEK